MSKVERRAATLALSYATKNFLYWLLRDMNRVLGTTKPPPAAAKGSETHFFNNLSLQLVSNYTLKKVIPSPQPLRLPICFVFKTGTYVTWIDLELPNG